MRYVLILMLLTTSASAQQSPESYCTNLSTWVASVTLKKVQGISKESVTETLRQEEETLPPELPGIVEAIYSPEMPEIREASDIAAIIAIFAEQCIAEVKRQNKEE